MQLIALTTPFFPPICLLTFQGAESDFLKSRQCDSLAAAALIRKRTTLRAFQARSRRCIGDGHSPAENGRDFGRRTCPAPLFFASFFFFLHRDNQLRARPRSIETSSYKPGFTCAPYFQGASLNEHGIILMNYFLKSSITMLLIQDILQRSRQIPAIARPTST